MHLFDGIIESFFKQLPEFPAFKKDYNESAAAPEGKKDAFLFRSDMAYELGGSGKKSVSRVLFGDNAADTILLYGKDLSEIEADCDYAHITLVSLKEQEESVLCYENLTDFSFRVYSIYPEGYHTRLSPSQNREQVRVAEKSIKNTPPLSFYDIGCLLIKKVKEIPAIDKVTTVFITEPDFDYRKLSDLMYKAKNITDAMERTLKTDGLDCAHCKMKAVCDEVEGLRELHIRKEQQKHESDK